MEQREEKNKVFCKNCGKELDDSVIFCPNCGTKRVEIPDRDDMQDVDNGQENKEPGMGEETENKEAGKTDLSGKIISRIWNSPLFEIAAIKFGNILEILEGVILLILGILVFEEGGIIGVVFGIGFGLGGAAGCLGGAASLLSRKKSNDDGELLDETAINKKKKNLCIGTVVIAIVLIVVVNNGGGTYSIVKAISFNDIGEETIGELVDENIKSPKWSQEKLDSRSKLVYVEGYCPIYGQKIQIKFYYEKKDGSHEVSLNGMYLPDSNEELNSFEAAVVWASFYN